MNITVKIRGGLGNQLFQYAYAKLVAERLGRKEITIDSSYFNKKHIRSIAIDGYNLPETTTISRKNRLIFDILYDLYRLIVIKLKSFENTYIKLISKSGYYFCDREMSYDIKINTNQNVKLAGYFQTEKDVREIINELRQELTPKTVNIERVKRIIKEIENSNNCIGISIRIGDDYKKFGWPVCTKNFYEKGVQEIKDSHPDAKLFIFSDCIDIVKNEGWFKGLEKEYVEGFSSAEGLYLLSRCRHFVIANSTFSWWGAYLSQNANKIIVAPEFFYRGVKMQNGGLHIPSAIYLNNFTGENI